ncbi:hypothetical protein KC343_g11510 [Hortaea werneckii]|nr:hypothetical protein KC352_g21224 [Hortaea werneckii]KAI7557314.1 hypothetical protein KC317_g11708 [Hortaea werneckii]KAI7604587.1 hypothetical protein KC346_g11407 [Hortaea werneckii]KAI7611613.1 hypothetical protein KC343_g11510 [Hortaea werneckii]KAI7650228.1 hypothetical protein KC319_g11098 [Hortaea werneckii]
MANRASITIYHSCDAPATPTLHHFKKGTLKRPRSNQDIHLPLPTEKVNIPRRHGILETVYRCAAPYCKDCAATEYEGNELTLTVAKSHGITGVNLRPSRTAKTAAERLQDGLERGRWIFSRETSLLSATNPQELSDRTQRFASFHPQAASFARVLAFLRGVPMEVEIGDSTPRGNHFEASERGAEDVPGLPLADTMPVGAFYGDFGKPTGSRDEGETLGNQPATRYHRSSEEVVKPGQKGGEGDIVFPRLMPGAVRGSTRLQHHRQNVRTWPTDAALQRRATQGAALPGGSWPLTQQPQRYHHHHHNHRRQNEILPTTTTTSALRPFPQPQPRWPTTTPTPSTPPGLQPLPPRPRDPNIMPTPPVAGGAAFAEDLALNFANGLVADKRLLEDAGLVAQGRRKKVRV